MKKVISFVWVAFSCYLCIAQTNTNNPNIIQKIGGNLNIGGYAQIDYNQVINDSVRQNGKLDVHRLVLLFNYKFTPKVSFVTEVELEHVKEVYVEQAFLNYAIKPQLQLRAGLMLIPMGIINEFHEPPTYNGVERPNLDKNIVPTTWRELGIGFTGRFDNLSLSYQAYVVNGFASYNNGGLLKGSNGFRSGRQKGAESFISSPNLSLQLKYYGINGLTLNADAYLGNTQSSLYNGMVKSDNAAKAHADSSVVGIAMFGLSAQYKKKAFQLTGQGIFAQVNNTDQYNALTSSDLGQQLFGYYLEIGYNVLQSVETKQALIPFIRFEQYNSHFKVTKNTTKSDAYARTEITTGLGWKITNGAILKFDYQWLNNKAIDKANHQINAGVGIWFN